MNWLARFFSTVSAPPVELDHLPVTGAPEWRDEKLKEARAKLGKPFVTEAPAERLTPPSHQLCHINARTEEARMSATVTPIKKGKRQ